MSATEKTEILDRVRDWFRQHVAENHVKNTKKLTDLSEFNVNPFLVNYLAQFAFGSTDAEALARALIIPRVLGTSITTSFGTHAQQFCHSILDGLGSTTAGIDIEFVDKLDGRHKWCQLKAGPQTINRDDVKTIKDHFKDIRGLARTNGIEMNPDRDCIVGVLYGTPSDLSGFYKKLDNSFPVHVGADFWHRLTGDPDFYADLSKVFAECADEYSSESVLEDTIAQLAAHIRATPGLI